MSPIAELAAVVREFPEVMLIVDSVSSFSAMPIPMDELGIDVLLTGSQKALALPPGLALFAVSQRALERAATVDDRGYYFDFVEFEKNAREFMTPSTPCISLIYGLEHKLGEIFAEGLANRHARHLRLNGLIHAWAARHGFEHFAPEGYRSVTLTTLANNKSLDLSRWNKILQNDHKIAINMGYGKIKGTTFRISNMGDETDETMAELIEALDASLAKL
jgi:aspartate aminotransferase-like enzyme